MVLSSKNENKLREYLTSFSLCIILIYYKYRIISIVIFDFEKLLPIIQLKM